MAGHDEQDREDALESVAVSAAPDDEGVDLHMDPDAIEEELEGIDPTEDLEAIAWRVAESLLTLRKQINAAAPARSKASDGTIGDTRHQGTGSDHNPHIVDGAKRVVSAMDITHDPGHGCDAGKLAASLHASRDSRIKYIIWNRRIANSAAVGTSAPWTWRPYNGRNPHDHHVHISVKAQKSLYDSTAAWTFSLA